MHWMLMIVLASDPDMVTYKDVYTTQEQCEISGHLISQNINDNGNKLTYICTNLGQP